MTLKDFYLNTYPTDELGVEINENAHFAGLLNVLYTNGDVYEYVFEKYIDKLSDDGIIIMEGGSVDRDNIEWMNKYNKPKIQPVIKKYQHNYNIKTIGTFPSITLIKK